MNVWQVEKADASVELYNIVKYIHIDLVWEKNWMYLKNLHVHYTLKL